MGTVKNHSKGQGRRGIKRQGRGVTVTWIGNIAVMGDRKKKLKTPRLQKDVGGGDGNQAHC